jgi:hypothetical protein
MKYLASDHNTLDRLLIDEGIPASLTAVQFNWADTKKFRMRERWNEKPERALLFSNYATEQNYFTEVKAACRKAGLSFDCVGMGVGRVVREPEKILGNYDIVFGKAKAAMEAMATGAAVIACDFRGLGGMVTKENFRKYRDYNFGMRILSRPVTREALIEEIASYDPSKAKEVALMLRAEAGLDKYIDGLLNHYHEVLRSWNTMKPEGNTGMQSFYSNLDEKLRHMNQLLLSKVEGQQKTIDRMQREIGLLKETPFHKAVRLLRRRLKKSAG